MNKLIKLFIALFLLSFSFIAKAEDIYTEPLFMDENIYYQPFPGQDVEAIKIKSLQDKDVKSMYTIGMMYRDGTNVDADLDQAIEWFKNAAEAGDSNSMIELARIYSLDEAISGVPKNQNAAQKWIKEAEKRNNPKALYTLGIMYEDGFPFDRSYKKSFEYYKKAAFRGVLNAYVKLYIAYQYGKGVEPDLKNAVIWLRKIQKEAPDGRVKEYARQMLGDIYFELALKEADPMLKFKLFNLSWANGNKYSLDAIGDMFQAGMGIKQSFTSAIAAYETSIKNYESVYAMERMGFIYLKGPAEITRDYAKSLELFRRASDLSGVTAAYMMGYMYFYGLGVERSPEEATKWFDRSNQFAQRKREESNVIGSVNDRSNQALKNILSDVSRKEEEKIKAIQEKIDSGKAPEIGPDLPDVQRY